MNLKDNHRAQTCLFEAALLAAEIAERTDRLLEDELEDKVCPTVVTVISLALIGVPEALRAAAWAARTGCWQSVGRHLESLGVHFGCTANEVSRLYLKWPDVEPDALALSAIPLAAYRDDGSSGWLALSSVLSSTSEAIDAEPAHSLLLIVAVMFKELDDCAAGLRAALQDGGAERQKQALFRLSIALLHVHDSLARLGQRIQAAGGELQGEGAA